MKVKMLDDGVNELHRMCLELVDNVVKSDELMEKIKIPKHFWPLVRQSWYASTQILEMC